MSVKALKQLALELEASESWQLAIAAWEDAAELTYNSFRNALWVAQAEALELAHP
jgi:hypothetical protein